MAIILLCILAVLLAGIYYYFGIFQKRDQYPPVKSTVSGSLLESSGYRKVEHENNLFTYYVPLRWTVIDSEVNVYGDLLTGSNTFMKYYPNSLGKLTKEVCASVSRESAETLSKRPIYSNISVTSSTIKKIGDYEGCLADYKTTIVKDDFHISQFFIFRQENIYNLFVQYPENLSLEKENADVILGSVIIKE